MDTLSVIATAAVGLITPYLVKAGEVAAKKIGEDIYTSVKARVERKPAAEEALSDLEKSPDDPDLQATMRVQLKKLLAEDDSFAEELRSLLEDAGGTVIGATSIRQIAGDDAKQFGQVFGNITFGQD